MRSGVVLPTFRDTPDAAFEVAAAAVAAGVDGVFCYDHIWPLGQPERPALAPFPVLGALATMLGPGPGPGPGRGPGAGPVPGRGPGAGPVPGPGSGSGSGSGPGEGPFLGTLVARIGLVANAVLASQFLALERLAPGRVIAGLGTGDSLSEEENLAYGIPFASAAERRAAMVELARELVGAGLPVWVAGGRAGRTEEARAAGAALTVWDAEPALVARRTAGPDGVEVTWAGPPPPPSPPLAERLQALQQAGATWAVFGWPVDVEELASATRDLVDAGDVGSDRT